MCNAARLIVTITILVAFGCEQPPDPSSSPPSTRSKQRSKAGSKTVSPPSSTSGPNTVSPPQPLKFTFDPPGQLPAGSGQGDADDTIYAPGMRFPIEKANAFANSQVYGHGGNQGPSGSECDPANYAYPWHDNFCESRGYSTPLCPGGKGHQGQDIRPASCEKGRYTAVAAEVGIISQIGKYTVYLSADSGRTFRYLHLDMNSLKVAVDQRVERGQPIGFVSNYFGSTSTTIHLHFEIKEPVTDGTATVTTFVPPYASLLDAYQRLLAGSDQ
jgi:murein DD-endopeptidase MepM/ murein hydrolase activator NlpD